MLAKVIFRIALLFLFISQVGYAQSFNYRELSEKVTAYNNAGNYDTTIELLESILADKHSTSHQRYHSYYLKYITYKRLFSYDKASVNLDLALQEAYLCGKDARSYLAHIKLEQLFVAFDLLKFDQVVVKLKDITSEDLEYIPANTLAFYWSVLAVMESKEQNFPKAIEYLDKATALLEKDSPVDLPLMYRKKIDIYRQMNQYDKALESFDKGLYYAKKYNMDIYILNMYYDLSYFYNQTQNYQKAIQTQEICNRLAKEYDEGTIIGRLNILEKRLQEQRIEKENSSYLWSTGVLVGFIALIVSVGVLLYWRNKKARITKDILCEQNDSIKGKLLSYSQIVPQENMADLQPYDLTDRQKQIIKLVRQGQANKEIAQSLHISENTVKYHLKNIYKLIGINSREAL